MNTTSSIALSGMQAAQTQLRASAHNVANLATSGFRRHEVVQIQREAGGVTADTTRAQSPQPSLEQDVVTQLQARHAFLANLVVFKSSHALTGKLLDATA